MTKMNEIIAQVVPSPADHTQHTARVATNSANDLEFSLTVLAESHMPEVVEQLAPFADRLRVLIADLRALGEKG